MTHMTRITSDPSSDAPAQVNFSFHPRLTVPVGFRWAVDGRGVPSSGDAGVALDERLCIVAGTRLITRAGRVPVERLAQGDMVWTLENGFQPLLSAGRHTVRFGGKTFARRPVILRKDALRPGAPMQDIRLSPKTKLLVDDWINEPDLNAPGTYVTGAQLIEQDRAERDLHCKSVTYFFLEFETPQVVECEGLLSRIPQSTPVSQVA